MDPSPSPNAPGAPRRRLWWTAVAVIVTGLTSACGAFSDPADTATTVAIDRQTREEGDREGQIGEVLNVYDLDASVLSVKRVSSYNDLDARGYIEVTVRMENPTNRALKYARSDWRLEKPDGALSNTATIANVVQLQDDSVAAGSSVEGTLIYTAGDLDGTFAIVFNSASMKPSDPLQAERGVWVFESTPEDAE